jgi:xanthine/uracil permease
MYIQFVTSVCLPWIIHLNEANAPPQAMQVVTLTFFFFCIATFLQLEKICEEK